MLSPLARAAEALLRPFGIRRGRPGTRREVGGAAGAGEGEGEEVQEDSEGWEVDPVQFIGAATGAFLAWWAMRRLTSSGGHNAESKAGGGGAAEGAVAAVATLPKLPLSEFLRLLRAGAVTAVTYLADRPPAGALLVKTTGTAPSSPGLASFGRVVATPCAGAAETLLLPGCHQSLFEELRSREGLFFECADMAAETDADMSKLSLLFDAGGLLVSIAALVYMLRGSGQGGLFGGRHLEDQANNPNAHRSAVTFDDVAGMESTKEELREVIAFLRNPQSFYALGAKPPRGILLTGPSGTGKTLLARAVAGEARVPFLYASSAAFVEIYVGQGAQRVRKFFEEARSCAPCIIFLDEIDAVGASRHLASSGGNQEYAQTLNQLLLELDGIESHAPAGGEGASANGLGDRTVVTMAATNRYDSLDEALVRPGRLDRIVLVSLPNLLERTATLRIHARGLRTEEGMDFEAIARRTAGYSGADLANLLNEAALLAARRGADAVRVLHIEEVLQTPRLQQSQQQQQHPDVAGGPQQHGAAGDLFGLGGGGAAGGRGAGGSPAELWARMLAAAAAEIATSAAAHSSGDSGVRGGGGLGAESPTSVTVAEVD